MTPSISMASAKFRMENDRFLVPNLEKSNISHVVVDAFIAMLFNIIGVIFVCTRLLVQSFVVRLLVVEKNSRREGQLRELFSTKKERGMSAAQLQFMSEMENLTIKKSIESQLLPINVDNDSEAETRRKQVQDELEEVIKSGRFKTNNDDKVTSNTTWLEKMASSVYRSPSEEEMARMFEDIHESSRGETISFTEVPSNQSSFREMSDSDEVKKRLRLSLKEIPVYDKSQWANCPSCGSPTTKTVSVLPAL